MAKKELAVKTKLPTWTRNLPQDLKIVIEGEEYIRPLTKEEFNLIAQDPEVRAIANVAKRYDKMERRLEIMRGSIGPIVGGTSGVGIMLGATFLAAATSPFLWPVYVIGGFGAVLGGGFWAITAYQKKLKKGDTSGLMAEMIKIDLAQEERRKKMNQAMANAYARWKKKNNAPA